ncbi:alpha/beta hydrolase [Rhodoferax sp. AJA081-3]|uniref:alpha/beta hydrolase n=1 Tax=Rhodoferax sp. AJA081-3 TaxID=2752316 RepID=UPI001ADF0DA7|nr:alpha/beta hydrolase [Rhodoferax sp. AJA081-3]QTN27111.1 alpha/beta hydrolase [Rhodoferax sp. AJA081-3]
MNAAIKPMLEVADIDPALAGFLAQAAAMGNPPIESLPPPIARQIYRDMANNLGLPAPAVGTVEDTTCPGPAGALPLRIYTPLTNGANTPLPVLLFLHGGGFVIGDLETHDKVCRTLCHHTGMLVVAVDYRLAPEHPFPAATDDAEAALRWVLAHATSLGGDANRIAVVGDSAGAQLALVAARRVQAANVRALGMIYPVAQHPDEPSASYPENEGKFLTMGVMQWFMGSYLGGQTEVLQHPDYALLKSGRFETLPATWVATMGHDPLRDEGHVLAQRIANAGVAVAHQHYPSAIHACIHFTAVSPVGLTVMTDLAQWLRQSV